MCSSHLVLHLAGRQWKSREDGEEVGQVESPQPSPAHTHTHTHTHTHANTHKGKEGRKEHIMNNDNNDFSVSSHTAVREDTHQRVLASKEDCWYWLSPLLTGKELLHCFGRKNLVGVKVQ